MLVSVPYIAPTKAYLNTLFIQPSFDCSKNCPGCYVKEYGKSVNHNPEKNRADISLANFLKHVNRDVHQCSDIFEAKANQVTMALDTLHTLPNGSSSFANRTMIDLFDSFLFSKKNSVGGEYHLTCNAPNDFIRYLEYHYFFQKNKTRVDLISFTNIHYADSERLLKIRKEWTNTLNWNFTAYPQNVDRYISKPSSFKKTLDLVDSMYLVLVKPGTGSSLDHNSYVAHQQMIEFVNNLEPEYKSKITIDGCISDSYKYNQTGFGCSSNVSRFQVWPDGSVSGCPYSSKPTTGPSTEGIKGIFENIYKAKKVYEFKECKIPDKLDSRKSRARENRNLLEIIE